MGQHRVEGRDPRLTRMRVWAGVAVMLVAVAGWSTSCMGETSASGPRPVAIPNTVATTNTVAPTRSSGPVVAPVIEAAHLARSVPVRLQIPAIGVDSTLMELGLASDGTMEVPPRAFPAGWFAGAPTPGELGPAIITGHVDLKGPGVFFDLHTLEPGDRVTVTRKDGSRPVFRVTRLQQFPKDKFPSAAIYGNIDHAGLRLITCGGSFNTRTGHYDDNVVAFAELVTPPG